MKKRFGIKLFKKISFWEHSVIPSNHDSLWLNDIKQCWRKNSIAEKSVFKSNEEEKKGNSTKAGYQFIYLWPYFRIELEFVVLLSKVFSFALETFSVNSILYKRKSRYVIYSLQAKTQFIMKTSHNVPVNLRSALNILAGLV